jgi:hypothetical protein
MFIIRSGFPSEGHPELKILLAGLSPYGCFDDRDGVKHFAFSLSCCIFK